MSASTTAFPPPTCTARREAGPLLAVVLLRGRPTAGCFVSSRPVPGRSSAGCVRLQRPCSAGYVCLLTVTPRWYICVDLDLYGLSTGVWTCHACYGCRGGKVSSRILWRFYQVFLCPHASFESIWLLDLLYKGYMFLFVSFKAKYI